MEERKTHTRTELHLPVKEHIGSYDDKKGYVSEKSYFVHSLRNNITSISGWLMMGKVKNNLSDETSPIQRKICTKLGLLEQVLNKIEMKVSTEFEEEEDLLNLASQYIVSEISTIKSHYPKLGIQTYFLQKKERMFLFDD